MSPRPMSAYKPPILICAKCSERIRPAIARMVGGALYHPTCAPEPPKGWH